MEINVDELRKIVIEEVRKEVKEGLREEISKETSFMARKPTDTPTDDLQVVPRKYVNAYGSIASRPQVSVVGQQFFSTTDGYPIFRNSNNAWVSATGSVVG
mgnify:CR=1 FL=1